MRRSQQAGDRRGVDDAAFVLFEHHRQHMLQPEEHADHVDVDDAAKRFQRILGDRFDLTFDAGIVVEHIDGAELVARGSDIAGDLVLLRDIGRHRQGLRGGRQILDGGLEVLLPAVDGDDAGPAFGQKPDRGGSNDAGSAGDDGDLAVQTNMIGHEVFPPLLRLPRRLMVQARSRAEARGVTIPFVVRTGKGSETALSPPYSAC
jgi:hypothetical protein